MEFVNRVGGKISITLLLGLVFALCSRWVELAAFTDPEGTFVRWSIGVASKMFTISAVLILLGGFQWQRAKMTTRLARLEEEILSLKKN